MKYTSLYILLVAVLVSQCKVNKNASSTNTTETRILEEITVTAPRKGNNSWAYQASETRYADLLHTTLWVSFNYEKEEVMGKAKLSLRPYFYPVSEITLDAKQFNINKVCLLKYDSVELKYSYHDSKLIITLDKEYTTKDTFEIFIDYVAHPSQITDSGSAAIKDAKGLYFINPKRTDKNKPRQIWSQGETQSNSGWFPTIDIPNEKMTQDIYLTVDSSDVTLSNGLLVYSTDEEGGKRTDYWSQKLPAAPYLTMIAVGEFVKTKDSWRDSVEVNYYLEKAYAPYAQMIFGNTPEMLECFSNRLGVDYPWEKFSQVVVRDFVSGAMENTSAVVHFEPVQHTPREHLDNNWEGIIAHELFHHWFGDLVTCESWSNIPLNESFATYGEYMWNESKYGKTFADYNFDGNLQSYLNQKNAQAKQVIRYHYNVREDMFDVVSYQKGSRIIHMLRNYVGDEAFFASLKLYLNQNKFGTVEVHNLRLAFETVAGQDLNWFFNQWFLNNGHPLLDVSYQYKAEHNAVTVSVKQTQDTASLGIYKLPVAIDIYSDGNVQRQNVIIDATNWSKTFTTQGKINAVNFDAGKVLLAKVSNHQTQDELVFQLANAPSPLDKKAAAQAILKNKLQTIPNGLIPATQQLFNDIFYGNRILAMNIVRALPKESQLQFEPQLAALSKHDAKPLVQSEAIDLLSDIVPEKYEALFMQTVNDSAYSVVGASLEALAEIDEKKALQTANTFLNDPSLKLQITISDLIAEYGKTDYTNYFEQLIPKTGLYHSYFFTQYNNYLTQQDSLIQQKAMPTLRNWFVNKQYTEEVTTLAQNAQKVFITKYDDAANQLKNKKLKTEDRTKLQLQQQTAFSMYTQWGKVIME
jgi:aminopeptidase N